MDMDTLLSVIENPTRRRILQAISMEPHYTLQLSKELGISQQAIMKNISILERNGFVEGHKEESSIGPERTLYSLTRTFSIRMDMQNGQFISEMWTTSTGPCAVQRDGKALEEIRGEISRIDLELETLERDRLGLVARRGDLMRSFMMGLDGQLDYLQRCVLYESLNHPNNDVTEISRDLNMNEAATREAIEGIKDKCRRVYDE